jgi:hypothetical protein
MKDRDWRYGSSGRALTLKMKDRKVKQVLFKG